MNAFDWVVALAAAVAVLVGFSKGAARVALGIAALVAGFFVATRFQDVVGAPLVKVGLGTGPSAVLSWSVLYLGTVVAGGYIGWLASRALSKLRLAWADRVGGASLGLVATALFTAALVHPLAASPTLGPRVLGGSALAPYAAAITDAGNRVVPEALANRYREGVGRVRALWRARREQAPAEVGPPAED